MVWRRGSIRVELQVARGTGPWPARWEQVVTDCLAKVGCVGWLFLFARGFNLFRGGIAIGTWGRPVLETTHRNITVRLRRLYVLVWRQAVRLLINLRYFRSGLDCYSLLVNRDGTLQSRGHFRDKAIVLALVGCGQSDRRGVCLDRLLRPLTVNVLLPVAPF